ncbi:hypothetical protein JZY06_09485 [Corynebacterium sp. CCM 8862]|uniref:Uncharacterized protein n=1 Tax=Corynebacterium mendelii TaxID=2765362 RepID=A0A939E307_9CORY|nr:hypothetical protein [Corynebacterium mendelii]
MRIPRQPTSRGEAALGLVWLSIGSLMSVLMEIVYLTARLPLPGGHSVVFPVAIVVAFALNLAISRTALLWTPVTAIAAIPVGVWLAGYFLFALAPALGGHIHMFGDLRSVLLLMCGVAGGCFPLWTPK